MLCKYNSQEEQWNRDRAAKTNAELREIRTDSMAIYNEIKKVSPAFAKNLVQKNEMVNRFVFQNFGDMSLLDRPICKHCESMALYDRDGSVYCFACNRRSWYEPGNIMTLRRYLFEVLGNKHFDEMQLMMLNQIAEEKEKINDGGRIEIIGK